MTNEEIKNKWYAGEPSFDELLDLARADERAKMQGVDVWVSMSDFNSYAQISMKEPEKFDNGSSNVTYLTNSACAAISGEFAKAFNISSGECAKFKIVRCG